VIKPEIKLLKSPAFPGDGGFVQAEWIELAASLAVAAVAISFVIMHSGRGQAVPADRQLAHTTGESATARGGGRRMARLPTNDIWHQPRGASIGSSLPLLSDSLAEAPRRGLIVRTKTNRFVGRRPNSQF
jgi:hypothetical protein